MNGRTIDNHFFFDNIRAEVFILRISGREIAPCSSLMMRSICLCIVIAFQFCPVDSNSAFYNQALAQPAKVSKTFDDFQPNEYQLRRVELEKKFRAALETIAKTCDAKDLAKQAKITRGWVISRDAQRLYISLPSEIDPLTPGAKASSLEKFWFKAFSGARKKYAQELFELTMESAEAHPAMAYRWFHDVLREDPAHLKAKSIAQFSSLKTPRLKKSIARHPMLPRKLATQVNTENFRIISLADNKQTQLLAKKLELWNLVWRQATFEFWGDANWLKRKISGDRRTTFRTPKHSVILFKDRAQYSDLLSQHIPGIERSLGYYDFDRKESFFFAGDEEVQSTWLHEMTHQLFQEEPGSRENAGLKSGIWAVEGIAMYFESLTERDGFVTIGGFDSSRLQHAKLHRFRAQFRPSFDATHKLTRDELQRSDEIVNIYSHSAAFSHFFMDPRSPIRRRAMLKYLQSLYQGKNFDLVAATELESGAAIDKEFDKFFFTREKQILSGLSNEKIVNFSAFPSDVGDAGVAEICKKLDLELLDLTLTRVTNKSCEAIGKERKLESLFLEGTSIGDQGIRKLVGLKNLRELDLSSTKITNACAVDLAKLPNLEVLWLSDNELTDAASFELTKIKTLKILVLTNTKMTHLAAERLKSNLPELEIKE